MRSYNDALLPGERKKIEMRSYNNALPPEEKKYNTPYVVKYKKKKGLG